MLRRMVQRMGYSFVTLAIAACANAPAPKANVPERAPVPSTALASDVGAAKIPSKVRIAVEPRRVSLNGRSFAVETPTKLQRVEPLFAELKQLHLGGAGPRYRLSVADGVTGLEFKSSFQTAAFAGWTVADWEGGAKPLTLKALVPLPPGAQPSASDSIFPKEPLVVVVRTDGVDLHRLRVVPPATQQELRQDEHDQHPPIADSIGQAPAATLDADLGPLLTRECTPERPCLPGVLFVEGSADTSLVRRLIALLASVESSMQSSELQVRASEPPARGEPLRVGVKVAQASTSGRLPPALIQSTVRKSYDVFRKCYEQDLARDPKLQGKVSVRFVIGRDGKVSNVIDGGSDLPDRDVVACVLKAFYSIAFQAPEDGIVTVVYPIMLEPG